MPFPFLSKPTPSKRFKRFCLKMSALTLVSTSLINLAWSAEEVAAPASDSATDTAATELVAPQSGTATVTRESMPLTLAVEGSVEAINQAMITAKTSGTISTINYDINDFVEKGSVLLEFEGVQNRAALDQARAGIGVAKAMLNEANNEYKRVKQLSDKKLVSASQLDKAQSARSTAAAQLNSAIAGLSAAADQAGDTVVRAPFSGYVIKRHVQLGENANPGQPLFSGVALDELRVLASIPQSHFEAVQARQQAHIEVLRPGGEPRRLEVVEMILFPYADQGNRQVGVRLNLKKGVEGILPGMLVKAMFDIGDKERLLMPKNALFQRSEVSGVYVLKDNKVSLRQVRIGNTFEDKIEILAGLEPGEEVLLDIVSAGQKLQAQLEGTHE